MGKIILAIADSSAINNARIGIMDDSDGEPLFAFQDLDYIPFGYSGLLAPYIETGPGTMRAAATLMALDLALKDGKAATTVVCDFGCGDGEFRKTAR